MQELNYKEFRCGNLVMFEDKIYPLHIVCDEYPFLDTDEFGVGIVRWNNIKPIKLTEEILIKLGFTLSEDEGDIKYYDIQRFWYYVVFDHNEIRLDMKCGKDLTHTVFYMDERFQYVHQLQNLYFGLTGKELVLN